MKHIISLYISIFSSLLLTNLPIAKAEIITDGTVGPPANLNGPDFIIGQELGSRVGKG